MPAINVPNAQWLNVYTASGITVGTAVLVQNQSPAQALLQISATAPDPTDNTGRRVQANEEVQVDASAAGLWIRCSPSGSAYVQSMS